MLNQVNQEPIAYAQASSVTKEHACQVVFADLFDEEGKEKKTSGKNILDFILRN